MIEPLVATFLTSVFIGGSYMLARSVPGTKANAVSQINGAESRDRPRGESLARGAATYPQGQA